jgi:hypothetical protein
MGIIQRTIQPTARNFCCGFDDLCGAWQSHGFVSRCETYPRRAVTARAAGLSAPSPLIKPSHFGMIGNEPFNPQLPIALCYRGVSLSEVQP